MTSAPAAQSTMRSAFPEGSLAGSRPSHAWWAHTDTGKKRGVFRFRILMLQISIACQGIHRGPRFVQLRL